MIVSRAKDKPIMEKKFQKKHPNEVQQAAKEI